VSCAPLRGASASRFLFFLRESFLVVVWEYLKKMATDPNVSAEDAKEAKLMKDIREQLPEEYFRKWRFLFEATLQAIQSSPKANEALRDLIRAGCNPLVVLREAAFYFPTEAGVELLDKQARYSRGQLSAIIGSLTTDAGILERIVREYMVTDRYYYARYAEAVDSPEALRRVAKSLVMALADLKRHTHGKIGRTKHLVYLSYHVRAATKDLHYRNIAKLVAGARGQTSYNIVKLEDTVRKTIRRHEKQDPEFFQEMKTELEFNLVAWRRWLSLGKPDQNQLLRQAEGKST
jgi:hypothetical protein